MCEEHFLHWFVGLSNHLICDRPEQGGGGLFFAREFPQDFPGMGVFRDMFCFEQIRVFFQIRNGDPVELIMLFNAAHMAAFFNDVDGRHGVAQIGFDDKREKQIVFVP
jgi:hypothetical protein